MSSLYEKLRSNLQTARKEKGWSQEKLSEEAGFSRTFVGMIERGYSKPSLDAIDQLADTLGIDAEELVTRSSTRRKKQSE